MDQGFLNHNFNPSEQIGFQMSSAASSDSFAEIKNKQTRLSVMTLMSAKIFLSLMLEPDPRPISPRGLTWSQLRREPWRTLMMSTFKNRKDALPESSPPC